MPSLFHNARVLLPDNADERKRHAGPDAQAASMYAGQTAWHARTRVEEAKLRATFATACPFPDAFFALHRLIYGGTTRHLASVDPVFADWGPQDGNTGIDALLQFALLSPHWLQSPEEWTQTPLSMNGDKRGGIASLARHLFCRYALPPFFDRAWLGGFDDFAQTFRLAFVHLGQGGKLEAVPFPCPLSHRAAHHFMHAPDKFSLPAALRWGQIKALNGHENLAHALHETFLQNAQPDEAFWFTFVQFLINHDPIPLWQVGPLADYVRFRKFGGPTERNDDELPEGPEPGFSMKGRTPPALLHSMTEWHDTLARINKKRAEAWPASRTIAPLDLQTPDSCSALTCRWRIREITQSLELMEEGRAMRHCISTYQEACEKGKTSLWSLRIVLFDPNAASGGPKPVSRRLLTLEVNNNRRAIVQVRGKCNQSLPSMRAKNQRMKDARDILRDWANREHLSVACAI